MKSKRIVFLLSLLISFVGFSQEDNERTEDLDEVVITATRTLRQLSSLPLPAQMISKKEIKSINSVRLIDILNEQTGLVTVPDYGGGEGIQLQGMDSQYTLILIDGVPLVGRLAGTLDLSRISVGNIKQIEVVKGASSSLYGNEALGGVINIITEKPKWGLRGDAYLRGDSFSTLDMGGTINYKEDNLGLMFFNLIPVLCSIHTSVGCVPYKKGSTTVWSVQFSDGNIPDCLHTSTLITPDSGIIKSLNGLPLCISRIKLLAAKPANIAPALSVPREKSPLSKPYQTIVE